MRIELIQPFINAADAVLADTFQGVVQVSNVTMKEDVYRRQGIAASVVFRGDIEGRVIFDLEMETALGVAAALAGGEVEASEELAAEAICELANMVVGNAVTLLNDRGFRFKILPPAVHGADTGWQGDTQSEALVMCFSTPKGKVNLNIGLDYSCQRDLAAPGVA
jgi:chemotaxis protein CheX